MDVPRYVLVHSPLVGPTVWEQVAKAAAGSGVGMGTFTAVDATSAASVPAMQG